MWVSRRYTCVTFIYLCTIHPCVSKSVLTHRRCFVGLQEVYLCDFYIFVYNTPLVETITPLVLSITYYHPSELLRPPFQAKFQNFWSGAQMTPKISSHGSLVGSPRFSRPLLRVNPQFHRLFVQKSAPHTPTR